MKRALKLDFDQIERSIWSLDQQYIISIEFFTLEFSAQLCYSNIVDIG